MSNKLSLFITNVVNKGNENYKSTAYLSELNRHQSKIHKYERFDFM